jgi:hypothetical protein
MPRVKVNLRNYLKRRRTCSEQSPSHGLAPRTAAYNLLNFARKTAWKLS